MPNIWTHILFCEDVVDTINNTRQVYFTSERVMKLGAQGPDPFFYYNFWPWFKDGPVQEIGTLIHTKRCGPFLIDLITTAKEMDDNVQAFVFGFITHHILDRHTHPYIHYRAGYKGSNHQRLEIIIDTLMMDKYHHLKTWKSPVNNEINVGFSMPKAIVSLLHETIHKHYPDRALSSDNYIQKSYRDLKRAQRILYDPYGWKNVLLKSFISAYSLRPVTDDKDFLNLNHTVWHHPATKESSTKSFIDLYNQSKIDACEIMPMVLSYWTSPNQKHPDDQLIALIDDISYDTGKPVALGIENKYSDPLI
ncbi:MAG TPA: zinc dependent phospholipase C family protein [Cerasibacillus sp.]|uniref:zinc dependent phospholipase C family protein n=1 Tax=Cerasibacillus sp. TaxID=2498711 RepID=UPI002F3FBFEB